MGGRFVDLLMMYGPVLGFKRPQRPASRHSLGSSHTCMHLSEAECSWEPPAPSSRRTAGGQD